MLFSLLQKPIKTFAPLLLLLLPTLTSASPINTHEFSLPNGLKVIVREDHRAPIVVSQLWYRVGSSYETPGKTGLAHVVEHMMFKGSSKLAPGESSRVLRELGAEENAFTSDDYTAYYQVLAKDRLEVALEMEADRLASLLLPEDEFIREMEVIKEERRMRTDDNPSALAYERFKALAYPASGYHIPTIGWMHDLDRLAIDDLRQWHNAWYSPNNAILVLAGDIQLEQAQQLVQRHFGKIPARPLPKANKPLELAEPGERRLLLHTQTKLPSITLGFNVPALTTAQEQREVQALRILAALLAGGDSARLPSQLERQQELAAGASAWYNPFSRGDSLLVISAVPNVQKNISLEQLEQAIWQQLTQLQQEPPTEQELARVRAQLIASEVFAQDSINRSARRIGMLEAVGLSWRQMDADITELESITAAEINQAARKYFTKSRSTTMFNLPEEQ